MYEHISQTSHYPLAKYYYCKQTSKIILSDFRASPSEQYVQISYRKITQSYIFSQYTIELSWVQLNELPWHLKFDQNIRGCHKWTCHPHSNFMCYLLRSRTKSTKEVDPRSLYILQIPPCYDPSKHITCIEQTKSPAYPVLRTNDFTIWTTLNPNATSLNS